MTVKSGTMMLVYKVYVHGRPPFTLPATLPVTRIREIAKTWPRPNQTAEAEVIKTANPKEKRLDKKYTNLSFAFMVS